MEWFAFIFGLVVIVAAALAALWIVEKSYLSDSQDKSPELQKENETLKATVDHLNQVVGGLHEKIDNINHEYLTAVETAATIQQAYKEELERNKKVVSQKKSSEVRLGLVSENLAPFLKDFPYDPKNVHFFGQPIDMIIFDYDQGEIIFFEIKSGGAKESQRQKTIKNMIKKGKVYYEKMTINEKGIVIKREPNE
jgi:predicted Holliday junction resolvase-like endonuclease